MSVLPLYCLIDHHSYIYIYIYMVFTTEGLFEVAIENWPEWDSVLML